QSAARSALHDLRVELPHRHVPLANLIEFIRPVDGLGRPRDPAERANLDVIVGELLCDAFTRESVIRSYLARHPEYLIAGGSR
ncbi:MAG: hypothetical protein WCJ30_25745, partial [Deltaproteobacteria bacterium]